MHKPDHEHTKLNQWFATAICGNDILSSALYVSGIAIIFAGVYAPLVLLFIGVVLFLYKSVYTEVVEALPVNGGAYNCLLNGTSKTIAATAGVMTVLSYVATSVLSGKIGIEYLRTVIPGIPVVPGTIILLAVFAVLVISGLKDSAKVAFGIFAFHVFTLLAFLLVGLKYYFTGTSYFAYNMAHTSQLIHSHGGLITTIYLAFSASLLGVSGFESSANFVEEQKKGVFRKTLRNMLAGVAFFNPLIALVVLNSLPYESIVKASDFLLADAAKFIGGSYFGYMVAIDAFLVLSGAVLTSFVGVSGLVSRMAGDNCLPTVINKQNGKGSYPYIVICFFLLCSSILILTGGNTLSLAGVYTISFLGVMTFFAFGNMVLKETRTELKRTYRAPLLFVIFAFIATFMGMIGNIRIDTMNLVYFAYYFIPSITVVLIVVYQDAILQMLSRMTIPFPALHKFINRKFNEMVQGRFVAFVHHPERLHRILDYINRNETGWDITLIHCRSHDKGHDNYMHEIKQILPQLKAAGVFPHFTIKLMYKEDEFGPELIDKISKELDISKSRIFIGSIHTYHPYEYSDLGGVRIIL